MERIVEIVWYDSLHASGWKRRDAVTPCTDGELEHRTVGYVLHDAELTLEVVQSWGSESVDAIMCIPKCCIRAVRELNG